MSSNSDYSNAGSPASPCVMVIFGASGDLAKRKVIPALYDLALHNSLGDRYAIIGYAYTRKFDDETAAVYYKKALEIEPNNSVIQGRLASLASSKRKSKEEQAK